jgi:protein-disulfide isomerase
MPLRLYLPKKNLFSVKALVIVCVFVLFNCQNSLASEGVKVSIDKEYLQKLIIEVINNNSDLLSQVLEKKHLPKKQTVADIDYLFKHRVKDTVYINHPAKGDSKATITVLCYLDYQCPDSSKAYHILNNFFERNPGKIKIVIKNNPLITNRYALAAAQASLAAKKQNMFWKYHELLLKNQLYLNETTLLVLAQTLDLNIIKFNQDRYSNEIIAQIEADIKDAKAHNYEKTPIININGVQIAGLVSVEYFKKILTRLLSHK